MRSAADVRLELWRRWWKSRRNTRRRDRYYHRSSVKLLEQYSSNCKSRLSFRTGHLAQRSQELLPCLYKLISPERGLLHGVEIPTTPKIQMFEVT
jgi:hypothetical protein